MPTGYARKDLRTKEWSARICALYSTGMSIQAVADEIGVHHSVIWRLLVYLNVPRRSSGMVGRRHTEAAKKAVGDANASRIPGDWKFTTDGGVAVYCPDHPHARHDVTVLQHRLVMEKKLGRYLLPTEVVHHINEIKWDNSEENLQLFESVSAHSKHHAPVGRKLSEETRRKMSIAHKLRSR